MGVAKLGYFVVLGVEMDWDDFDDLLSRNRDDHARDLSDPTICSGSLFTYSIMRANFALVQVFLEERRIPLVVATLQCSTLTAFPWKATTFIVAGLNGMGRLFCLGYRIRTSYPTWFWLLLACLLPSPCIFLISFIQQSLSLNSSSWLVKFIGFINESCIWYFGLDRPTKYQLGLWFAQDWMAGWSIGSEASLKFVLYP